MNREIKFRSWDKYKGMSIPGDTNCIVHFDGRVGEYNSDGGYDTVDDILMQYTGLKDKNGVDIYEGDILASSWDTMLLNWKIEFEDGGFSYVNIGINGYLGKRYKCSQSEMSERVVIGNIYENPELLKP